MRTSPREDHEGADAHSPAVVIEDAMVLVRRVLVVWLTLVALIVIGRLVRLIVKPASPRSSRTLASSTAAFACSGGIGLSMTNSIFERNRRGNRMRPTAESARLKMLPHKSAHGHRHDRHGPARERSFDAGPERLNLAVARDRAFGEDADEMAGGEFLVHFVEGAFHDCGSSFAPGDRNRLRCAEQRASSPGC